MGHGQFEDSDFGDPEWMDGRPAPQPAPRQAGRYLAWGLFLAFIGALTLGRAG